MWCSKYLSTAALGFSLVISSSAQILHTSSRWIVDEQNARVKLRCVNWAGHMEVNIPEGLQHQPVATIASWIKTNNFNCVRLTFSIDLALSPNSNISTSFTDAVSAVGVDAAAMQTLYDSVVTQNPWADSSSTLGAFAKVIEELDAQGIMVVLDNHNSRGKWCCGTTDGNGWWDAASGYDAANSEFFKTQDWLDGLTAMATFSANHPNVVGLALRNELRAVGSQDGDNHADWYKYVAEGAAAVHGANKDLLIVVGGVNYATDMSFVFDKPFDRSPYPNKILWEFHNYEWSFTQPDCNEHKKLLGDKAGFLLSDGTDYTGPLWLSEFGWAQNNPSAAETSYSTCLISYMEENDADWAYWALQGSYYVRDGEVNKAESFGILDAEWKDWNNPSFPQTLAKMFNVTQGV